EQHDVGEGAADVDADTIRDGGGHAARYSAACRRRRGSCHCTLGTSLQPRRRRMSSRSRRAAAASTVHAPVSTTTPYSASALAADRNSLRTSLSTAAGSRSKGSPQPPPPGCTWQNTSPRFICIVTLE